MKEIPKGNKENTKYRILPSNIAKPKYVEVLRKSQYDGTQILSQS
jgi:hypothetical protein